MMSYIRSHDYDDEISESFLDCYEYLMQHLLRDPDNYDNVDYFKEYIKEHINCYFNIRIS